MSKPTIAVVSVSGGKDSALTADKAKEQHGVENCRFVMCDTGNESDMTMQFVRGPLQDFLGAPIEIIRPDFSGRIAAKRLYVAQKWPEKGVPAHIVERALEVLQPMGNPFLDLCLWKGRFPSRLAQFCTQELKRYPLDQFTMDVMAEGYRVESWRGVRRDESDNRRDALEREFSAEGWEIVRPIVHLTAAEVFSESKIRGIPINPLYLMGCSRVGCFPCINCTKDELAIIARRFPEEVKRIRYWETIVSQCCKLGFSTFFYADGADLSLTPEEIFDRWNIDGRVDWAMTSRGGKQYDLLRIAPPPSCSSVYGLCE
jgi:3'-phosphoadenosine 5'-phosphosulfate sulfotransferase (PAPS reductase)/FAD synthetase